MLNSFLARVSRIAFNDSKPKSQSSGVYRDDLVKKGQPRSISEPLLMDGDGGVIRVKVKMTKHEAARLLSKCKPGGLLQFQDVAEELRKIPVHRVYLSNTRFCMDNEHVLESIHEQSTF